MKRFVLIPIYLDSENADKIGDIAIDRESVVSVTDIDKGCEIEIISPSPENTPGVELLYLHSSLRALRVYAILENRAQ